MEPEKADEMVPDPTHTAVGMDTETFDYRPPFDAMIGTYKTDNMLSSVASQPWTVLLHDQSGTITPNWPEELRRGARRILGIPRKPEVGSEVTMYQWPNPSHMSPLYLGHERESSAVRGCFSSVLKVKIHSAQYFETRAPENPAKVAVKELLKFDNRAYRAELDALQQFQHPQRTHSVNAIASITTGYNDRYLLFPWAKGGHLQEFWNKSPECSLRRSDLARWTAGLADGLASLMGSLHHKDKSYARHGDLRPDNILRFHEGERRRLPLYMSDLGLTKLPSMQASHRQETIGYRSPESESRKERHSYSSRSMDIWSLGCTFLELIMWSTLQPRELAEDAKPGGLDLRGLNALFTSRIPTPTAIAHVKPGLAYRWMKHCISYHPTID